MHWNYIVPYYVFSTVLNLHLSTNKFAIMDIGNTNVDGIAIIDCSKINGSFDSVSDEEMCKIAKEFGNAMSGIGFAYMINHGVNLDYVENIYGLSKQFFELPIEIKQKYRKTNPGKIWNGYTGPGNEILNEHQKNSTELHEALDIWGPQGFTIEGYPSEIPEMKNEFDGLRTDCNLLVKKLFRCLGKYLNLEDEDFFVKNHQGIENSNIQTQTHFRTLYYFPIKKTDNILPNAIRCGEHTDWGTITLLFQDMIGGLEVKRTNGDWVPASPIKDSILINSGQLLELWSAGRLPATPHRVRIMNEERLLKNPRQSCVYFVNPDGDTKIKPILPILPGKEEFKTRPTVIAYDHYLRLMKNATGY